MGKLKNSLIGAVLFAILLLPNNGFSNEAKIIHAKQTQPVKIEKVGIGFSIYADDGCGLYGCRGWGYGPYGRPYWGPYGWGPCDPYGPCCYPYYPYYRPFYRGYYW